jgi:hypothetical protein
MKWWTIGVAMVISMFVQEWINKWYAKRLKAGKIPKWWEYSNPWLSKKLDALGDLFSEVVFWVMVSALFLVAVYGIKGLLGVSEFVAVMLAILLFWLAFGPTQDRRHHPDD